MKTIKLNNGVEMPLLGYGVYQITPEVCEKCVMDALSVGYRSIDTAQAYYNEEQVGSAIIKSGIPRGEIFITTKMWLYTDYDQAKAAIDDSLRKLQTDYIDLLLVHQPVGNYHSTYRAMEDAYRAGKVRALGVSNFYPDRFIDLAEQVEIKPAVNQMVTHVFNQQKEIRRVMEPYGTALMSWGPFAEGQNNFFRDPTLTAIGEKYGKTAAQTALRFLIQEDIIVIPKSSHIERMKENFEVFDFELSPQDMQSVRDMDIETSFFPSHYDPEFVRVILSYGKP